MPAEIITARYTTTCKRVVGKNARKNQTPNNFKETQENIKMLKIFSVRLTQFWSRNVNIGLLQTSPHIVVIIAFSVKKYFSSRKLEYLRAAQSHRNRQSAWCFRSSPALFVSSEPVFLTLIISVFWLRLCNRSRWLFEAGNLSSWEKLCTCKLANVETKSDRRCVNSLRSNLGRF